MVNSLVINIGIKAFTSRFCKYFSKISTVIAKEWCNAFELDIRLIVVVDIVENIIQNGISGWIAGCIHDHFCLF